MELGKLPTCQDLLLNWLDKPSLLPLPHGFLLFFEVGLQPLPGDSQFAFQLGDFRVVALSLGGFDAVLQRDFALGDLRGVEGIEVGDLRLLFRSEFDRRSGLVQPLHGEFVGAFHGKG